VNAVMAKVAEAGVAGVAVVVDRAAVAAIVDRSSYYSGDNPGAARYARPLLFAAIIDRHR